MKIIFLDFDGVMDTAYYDDFLHKNSLPETDKYGIVFDPYCIKNLKYIIDNTRADIVISSTWKDDMTYNEILDMWKDRNLPGFVTDVTPTVSRHRGNEIDAWLEECRDTCRYAIIDDLDSSNFNPHQLEHLFIVNPYCGLDEDTARRIVQHLSIHKEQ
jgi:hypothetical protein